MTLSVQRLSGGYGANRVLFDVDLSIGEGEVVCLMGRNGMGKTTTVHSILGLLPKKGGNVTFQGVDITGLAADQIARLGVGLVPEGRHIFPNLSLHENLMATAASRTAAEEARAPHNRSVHPTRNAARVTGRSLSGRKTSEVSLPVGSMAPRRHTSLNSVDASSPPRVTRPTRAA